MRIEGLNINKIVDFSFSREIKGYDIPLKAGYHLSKDTDIKNASSENVNNTDENKSAIFYKAFFAIDENKNVIIKVVDSDGNLIRQIPPEEFLKVAESLKIITKKLLHLEV